MADTRISGFSAVAAVAAANEFAVNEAGTTKKASVAQLRSYFNTWEGNIAAAFGDGNPNLAMLELIRQNNIAATPTNISTTVGRISYFKLATALTVNKIRYYGVGATTNIYRIAIYNADTLARVLTETQFTTTANAWGAIGSSLNLTLSAGQLYFLAVGVNATGTTAGVLCLGSTSAATTGQIQVLPKSWPGNLDIDSGYVLPSFGQGALTSGALPDPFPTVAFPGTWTGGMPAFFLDNSNA